jgi:hypothetical protein
MALVRFGSEPGGASKIASACGVGEGTGVRVGGGVGVAEGIVGVAVEREGRARLQATSPKQPITSKARIPNERFSWTPKLISPGRKLCKTSLFYLRRDGFVVGRSIRN